jgi:predicted alpha/beta hydrolase family esterase
MNKNAIILHGTADLPEGNWRGWLRRNLESRGYHVWVPQLPNSAKPNREEWIPFILDNGTITEETVIIGHSAGAQIILSVLEKIDIQIKQAILVAGYAKALRETANHEKNTEDYDWEAIKGKCKDLIFVNSDNDPWTCDDKQGRIMMDHLGGTQIILHGEGHMGSTYFNQPYEEFPLLLKLID